MNYGVFAPVTEQPVNVLDIGRGWLIGTEGNGWMQEMIFHYGDNYRQYLKTEVLIQPKCFVYGRLAHI
jgi:hypothetical protein